MAIITIYVKKAKIKFSMQCKLQENLIFAIIILYGAFLLLEENSYNIKKGNEVMPFIGVIADEKNENFIRREIVEKLKLRESSVLFIKEKSIENIKNIKFETIVIARKFKNMEILKKMLVNTNYLIVNTDRIKSLEIFKEYNLKIYTFGFNSKAVVTASSVSEDGVLICVGKEIEKIGGGTVEPQEIKVNTDEEAESVMAVACVLLIYGVTTIL